MTRFLRRTTLVVFSAMLLGVSGHAQQVTVPQELVAYPDMIVYNGKIVSMDDPGFNSSTGKTYQAMAVREDRIQFLGSTDQVLRYAGPRTQKIDLQGRTVVPGIINTHTHLHNGAVSAWSDKNPEKVESIRKKFSVAGKTFEELTRGIELVVKEQMSNPLPGQWAWIGLEGGATGIGVCLLLDLARNWDAAAA